MPLGSSIGILLADQPSADGQVVAWSDGKWQPKAVGALEGFQEAVEQYAPAPDLSSYATTAFVNAAIDTLKGDAGEALDTLGELADALNDDVNFAATVITSLDTKLSKSANLSDLTDAPTARTNLGLGSVENTALSTWAGSTSVTTLGTIVTGVWHGTAVADAYVASAATWNAKANLSGGNSFSGDQTIAAANALLFDTDVRLRRTAASTLTLDDGAGGFGTLAVGNISPTRAGGYMSVPANIQNLASLQGTSSSTAIAVYSPIVNYAVAGQVPLSLNLAASQTANAINVTSNGGTAGDKFKVTNTGAVGLASYLDFNAVNARIDTGGGYLDINALTTKLRLYSGVSIDVRTPLAVLDTATFSKRISSGTVSAGTISSGTYAHDASAGDLDITLGANTTLAAPTNAASGQRLRVRIKQDGTGTRTLTLASGAGGWSVPTQIGTITASTTAGAVDTLFAVYDATADRWVVEEWVRADETSLTTKLALKANLAGGNSFSGDQTIAAANALLFGTDVRLRRGGTKNLTLDDGSGTNNGAFGLSVDGVISANGPLQTSGTNAKLDVRSTNSGNGYTIASGSNSDLFFRDSTTGNIPLRFANNRVLVNGPTDDTTSAFQIGGTSTAGVTSVKAVNSASFCGGAAQIGYQSNSTSYRGLWLYPGTNYGGIYYAVLGDDAGNTYLNSVASVFFCFSNAVKMTMTASAFSATIPISTTKRISSGVVAAGTVSSGTYVTDASLSNEVQITLGANTSFSAPMNPTNGQRLRHSIAQPAAGGPYTITLAGGAGGFSVPSRFGTIAASTTASALDVLESVYNSTLDRWVVDKWIRADSQARGQSPRATFDGGSSAPAVGETISVPVERDGVITAATILAKDVGSIVFDVKKSTYANWPTSTSIVASAPPTLSSARKSRDTTLTGWTTDVSAGDVLDFVVSSASTLTRATLILTINWK